MNKALILATALICPVLSHAGTALVDQPSEKIEATEICKDTARKKLLGFDARAVAEVSTFRLVSLDARPFNPSHYAWYEMDVRLEGRRTTVRTLVQLDRLSGSCF